VACRSCFAPVVLDPAVMSVSSFGVMLRCPSCDALVPVRRYDPERGAGTLGQDAADRRPAPQWKLADALGLADRDVNPRSSATDAVMLSFPAPKPRVSPPTPAPERGDSQRPIVERRPDFDDMPPPVDT
jgi:hypothetical protein